MKMTELSGNKLIKIILSIPEEDGTTEFKRLGSDLSVSKVIESVVAMANTDGGYIVFGVDDPQKSKLTGLDRVFGIEESAEKYDEIGRNIQRITPPIAGIWPPLLLPCENKKTMGVLNVPKAIDSFHAVDNHVFVRLTKGNKRLSPHEVVKLSYAKGFQRADRELVDVDFDLLKTEFYERWRVARKIHEGKVEDVLFSTGLARKDDSGVLKPTRAAILLFALYPHNLLDTKCTIRIFQYEGTIESVRDTINLIGTPKTIDGPIIKQIENAHEHVLTLLRAGMRIPASGFVTTYRIPERPVKEAITNAVIHRDYFIKRDIEIRVFEDRVEIESPGLFPYNITRFNIGVVRAEGYRNDLVVKHLREFPDPPNLDRNEGVRAMRSEMDKGNLYPPIFLTYPNLQDMVRVVLFNMVRATEWDKVSHYLTHKEKYVTNEIARKILNNPDTSKISRILKRWVEQGLLVKVDSGAKKTVKYRLPVDEDKNLLFVSGDANKK